MATPDRPPPPLSKDAFAALLREAIERAGETEAIDYDPAVFSLHRGGSGGEGDAENTLFLINAYNEYLAAPEAQRPVIVRNFVRVWFSYRRELPEDLDGARHDLLPAIRSRMLFENATMEMRTAGKKGFDWPYRELGHYLGVGLVYDLPTSMHQLLGDNLRRWGTTYDEAYEIAGTNLRAITRQPLDAVAPGVWASPWRDNYDPSRILLTEYLRAHAPIGDPVVMVPNRDTLLLTGAEDEAGLTRLVEIAEAAYEHPRSLSGIAFRLTEDDAYVPFLPPPDHPAHMKFRLLEVKNVGSDYAEQKASLDKLHEQTGRDIFVASYFALSQRDTGAVRTYCVWSEGVLAFLPQTDDIYFVRPEGDPGGPVAGAATWADALRVLGERMKPVGLYPERYLVEADSFPSDEELTALRSRS